MSLVLMGKDNPQLGKAMCFPLALKMIEKTREKTKQLPEEGTSFVILDLFQYLLVLIIIDVCEMFIIMMSLCPGSIPAVHRGAGRDG